MKLLFFISLLIATACANSSTPPNTLQQSVIRPGMVTWLTFDVPKDWETAKLMCRGNDIKHSALTPGKHFAYVAETYFSDLTPFDCKLVKGKESREISKFEVKPYTFPEEKLKVDYRKVDLSKKDLKRAQQEQAMLAEIYMKSEPSILFSTPFQAPLNSVQTSIYGVKRTYNNAHKGQHLGTDFRAQIGVPVPAANSGKVVYSGNLFFTGWTVIIDHGMDIFTVYGHLSEVKVKAGETVSIAQIIGLSGNTGRSSGPHLHWGVKVHGNYVDGYSLIEQSKEQFR